MKDVTKSSKKLFFVAGIVLILIILILVGGPQKTIKNTTLSNSQEKSISQNLKVGDTAQAEGLQISIPSAIKKETYIDSGGDKYDASQGAVWLVAFVQYQNISDRPINLPLFDRIVLYDPNGYKYTESVIGVGYPFPSGTNECSLRLFPTTTCTGYTLFIVSRKTLTEPGWYFVVKTGNEYIRINLDTSKL